MVIDSPSPTETVTRQLTITLSREELYLVMRLIKAPLIPGFDTGWLKIAKDDTLSDETLESLTVATNALIARGYLTNMSTTEEVKLKKVKLSLPSFVIALVGACAFSDSTIFLMQHSPETSQQCYLHAYRGVSVVHSLVAQDIHQFMAVDGRQGMLEVLDAQLGLHAQTDCSVPGGTALSVHVQAARDAAIAGSFEEAEKLLVRDDGLPLQTAKALSKAIHDNSSLNALIIVRHDASGERHQDSIALVVSSETCFLLSDGGSRPATFYVQSVSAADIRKWIIARLPQARD